MKLKTKLIPLASIGAVCAAVTPLALTSCGSKENFVDLMEGYTPDFAKVKSTIDDPTEFTEFEAMNAWTDNVIDEPERIAQENYWSEARNVQIINSRAYITDFDPGAMWKNVLDIGPGSTVVVGKAEQAQPQPAHVSYGDSAVEYEFSNVVNRTMYSTYKERMTNISVTTQPFTFIDDEYEFDDPITIYIPTISFRLEYKRTYQSGYSGIVKKRAYINSYGKNQAFDMQATRENIGTLVFDNVPVWIADIQDPSGQACWTIVPFIQWGCEENPTLPDRISYSDWLEDQGYTLEEEDPDNPVGLTLRPRPWTIKSTFTNRQVGDYLSDTNGFDVDFEATTTEQLTSQDMTEDYDNLMSMSTWSYIVEGGVFASWYIHNTMYDRESLHLWSLDFFYNK